MIITIVIINTVGKTVQFVFVTRGVQYSYCSKFCHSLRMTRYEGNTEKQ